jgi:nitroreductase
MELDTVIQSRKSTRKFSNKKPDWRNIIECIDAARYTPMAGGMYSLKFILVSDEEKINQIAEASQQDFIAQAKYVLVVCSSMTRTKNAYGEEKGEIWCRQQAGAAIQNFLLKIEEFKLSTCWVGHFLEEQIKGALKISDDIQVEAVFPIGYDLEKSKTRKAKINLDRVLYFNRYGNTHMIKEERKVE